MEGKTKVIGLKEVKEEIPQCAMCGRYYHPKNESCPFCVGNNEIAEKILRGAPGILYSDFTGGRRR